LRISFSIIDVKTLSKSLATLSGSCTLTRGFDGLPGIASAKGSGFDNNELWIDDIGNSFSCH
jgi:hypothetical protein